jgi:hypothetical protein
MSEKIINHKSRTILIKTTKPKPSKVYDTYWKFAAERQAIFYRRLESPNAPWTSDLILNEFKFTNAYRASDRVSQYLIKEVIYKGNQSSNELLFRILLFKIFNKIETWELLEKILGPLTWENYDFELYNRALQEVKIINGTIYSGAYIMASGKSFFGYSFKHENHLKLIEKMINDNLAEKLNAQKTMMQVFNILKEYPTIGDFLAYQYAIDINYSTITDFTEMEFVKAGPGAKDGIRKCFSDYGNYTEEDIIKKMVENQHDEFDRLELDFNGLWGRPLQLIDCQNIFCEVDKYARVAHPEISGLSNRRRIKQKFRPAKLKNEDYFFPPNWNINQLIK